MISAAVLAREASLSASADASVCPLTRTTRELASCSSTDGFLSVLNSAERAGRHLCGAARHRWHAHWRSGVPARGQTHAKSFRLAPRWSSHASGELGDSLTL